MDATQITEKERHQLLEEWNVTQADFPRDKCVHELFEEQVQRTPDAVAIIFEAVQLTYRELNQRANQLAHRLQQQGVGLETLVGLYVERSLEMVIGLLGILKAGGAYVPLDPTYPAERVAFMLEDAQVSVLITQRNVLMPALPCAINTFYLDTNEQELALQSAENLITTGTSDRLAYVIYTSGSTGRPKGVLGTHRAALNRFNWMWRTYPFALGEVCCQKTSLSFVDSVWEIFGPLLQGVQTVIIPAGVVKDPQQFVQVLAAHSVTRIVLVPSLLRTLLDSEVALKECVPDLKLWTCSGETLPLELVRRFQQQLPDCVLLNLYGSSEVAADVTCYEIKSNTELSCVPIGRPIDNTQIYLLDQHMQLVPVGIPGELYVGGDGLARGYLHRPELTEERFINHPFSTQVGARVYKTGDLARYQADGTIELIGRIDHQVKIRGFRIELGEIEAILRQHPLIREVAVVAREDTVGKRLVAYLIAVQESLSLPRTSELRHFLATKLPEYMLPSAFVFLEAFPQTSNGKLDRRALAALQLEQSAQNENYAAPETSIEEILAQVWTQVLGLKRVGIYDNFFDLGGQSLLATQIIARLNNTLEINLSFATLFKSPTIVELAMVIEEMLLAEIEEQLKEEVED